MSEANTTTESASSGVNEPLGEGGLKALQAERDARKAAEKTFTDAQAAWDIEKATFSKQLADATKERDEARLEAARSSVFRTKNIPSELEEFITGATKDELAASADKALAAFHPASATPTGTGAKPNGMAADLTQGASDLPLNSDELEQSLRAAVGI